MTVLVAYTSRAGSTRGVAERIAARLRSHGRDVHLDPLLGREEVDRFEAVVLGSPIYSGAWETEAVDFLLGATPAPWPDTRCGPSASAGSGKNGVTHDAKGLDEIQRLAPAREHRFFARCPRRRRPEAAPAHRLQAAGRAVRRPARLGGDRRLGRRDRPSAHREHQRALTPLAQRRSSRISTRGKRLITESVSAALTNPARSNSFCVPT